MTLEDDRKRGQVYAGAIQLAFKDPRMLKVITTGYTILRCTVEANRLISLAADVQRKHDNRKNKKDEMSKEDSDVIKEGKKAEELLYLIKKPID